MLMGNGRWIEERQNLGAGCCIPNIHRWLIVSDKRNKIEQSKPLFVYDQWYLLDNAKMQKSEDEKDGQTQLNMRSHLLNTVIYNSVLETGAGKQHK